MNKTIHKIALFLSLIILIQSCVAYSSSRVTKSEAVSSKDRVLLKTNGDEFYKFKYLEIEDGNLYGVTRKNSSTAKLLRDNLKKIEDNNRLVKILVPEETIKEYKIKNGTSSTLLTIMTVLATIAAGISLFAAIGGLNFSD